MVFQSGWVIFKAPKLQPYVQLHPTDGNTGDVPPHFLGRLDITSWKKKRKLP